MKTLKLLIPFLLLTIVVKAQMPTDEFFEHFVLKSNPAKAPAGYGFSADNPITVGAYVDLADQAKVNGAFSRFANTYQWADGSRVEFIDRKTVMINAVNYDKIRTVKPGTKDTLTLFVDMYKSAPVSVPEGFKLFTKEQLAADFAPELVQLKAYYALPDKYGDPAGKLASIKIISFLQSSVGIEYLMDKDYVGVLTDYYGMDADLKAYLIRSYIFHKFENELTGQDNCQVKAFNAMVDDYQDVVKKHPELITGDMKAIMVKK